MRRTPERDAILDAIVSFNNKVFTIEMLSTAVAGSALGALASSTLYSNLDLLVAAGIVTRLHFDGVPIHYALAGALPQTYLVCTSCGRVKAVADKHLIAFMNTRRYPAFSTSRYSVTVYGVCNGCARRMRRLNMQ